MYNSNAYNPYQQYMGTIDFDIGSIMGDQEEKFKKYCEKIKEIWR